MNHECDGCGLAACDLPDGVDPEFIFEGQGDGTELCQGCANNSDWKPGLGMY